MTIHADQDYEPFQLIGWIMDFLQEKHAQRLQKQIHQITELNNAQLEEDYPGFLYKGTFYPDYYSEHANSFKTVLKDELWPKMADYVELEKSSKVALGKIKQVLLPLLRGCSTLQDLRDALPDALLPAIKGVIPRITDYTRQREEAYLLKGTPFWPKWEAVRPEIAYFAMGRMF